jgi:hypothetical protein
MSCWRRASAGQGRRKRRSPKPVGIDDVEIERHVDEISHTYGARAQTSPAAAATPSIRAAALETHGRHGVSAMRAAGSTCRNTWTRSSLYGQPPKTCLIIEPQQRAGFIVRPKE